MRTQKDLPLMPKATAIWLIDNTTLTFKQIADFCGMHELEVEGIADGEVASGVKGENPIDNGQLTQEELDRCSSDSNAILQMKTSSASKYLGKTKSKNAKYTPIARRQDKPDAIFWLIKNVSNITDNQIIKLIGTTKTTVDAIRNRSHWNVQNIRQRDPALLGLCSQTELDRLIETNQAQKENAEDDVEDKKQ